MCFVEYLHNILKNLFYKEAEMKKFLFSSVCLGALTFTNKFSSDEFEGRNAYYLGCKAYPPGHYKACQTGNQHILSASSLQSFWLVSLVS